MPPEVDITLPDGSPGTVPEEQLGQALAAGAKQAETAAPTDWRAGDLGSVASGAVGLARGVTLGAFDPAFIEASRVAGNIFSGGDLQAGEREAADSRRALNEMKELHPDASLGGEIAGSLAGLAMIPGGAAAEGVEGSSVLARAASRVAGAAPRLAGEGAAMGVGGQASEDALGDHQAAGENYVAAGLKGGLLNLFVGGALHAGGGLAKDALGAAAGKGAELLAPKAAGAAEQAAKASASDIEALAERKFGVAGEGVGERVRQQLVKWSASLSGKNPEAIEALGNMSPESREARRIAVFDSEKELSAATKEFRSAGDEMLQANKLSMHEFQGELKAEKIAKAVKTGNEGDVVSYAKKQIQSAIETAESELNHADGVAPQAVKSLEGIARTAYHADAELTRLVEAGDDKLNAKTMMLLDGIKRDTQAWVNGGYNSIGKIADPYEARLAERSVRTLDTFQNTLRNGLEDAELFGKAGDIQKAINAEWTIQIDASKRFHQALTTEVGRDPTNPFRTVRGIDPTKADTYARGLLNPDANLTHQTVKEYVSSTENLAKVLRDNVELSGGKAAEVERVIQSAQRFKAATAKAEKTLTAVNQFKQLTEHNSDGYSTLLGMLGLSTGPLGAVAGAAIGSIANPARVISQLAAIERMGTKLDLKMKDGALAFLSGSKRAASESTLASKASRETTGELVDLLREGTRSPAALSERIAESLKGLRDYAPNVAAAAAATIMRAAMHVQQVLPKEPPPTGMGILAEKRSPLKATDRSTIQATVEVLESPESVINALADGKLSRDHIRALAAIYPKRYASIQQNIKELAQKEENLKKLSLQQEAGMSVLFGTPVGAMMQPKTVRGFQATFVQGADPSQQGKAGGQTTTPNRPLGKAKVSMASAFDRPEAPA